MNTVNFLVPPNSPLQRSICRRKWHPLSVMLVVLTGHLAVLGGLLLQQQWRGGGVFGAAISDTPEALGSAIASKTEVPTPSNSGSVYAPPAAAGAPALPAPLSAPMPVNRSSHAITSVPHTDSPPPLVDYLVRPGDNLIRIAKAHRTTVKALRTLNHLDSDRLWAGQKLHLPPDSAASIP